ncbi:transcriptional regulator GlxA family with amidase domain [Pseudarthrobacter sp. W1I19]|uniref:GlxA family transcriptional regulator n=1 Tax=Pseudarthrobacter sp. W1I19 TaxID=3042288 RepID=UPI00277D215E|nr:GlxA family transcriptional regulator [Pseudarthrobacter sp. W1I19]MDQ0923857.1 transcriptional regulator GlxA family with amidase domain [Pseudarthrobacter sp. W1I19]
MANSLNVVFVVFDGVKLLDVSGPAEVFAEANMFGADYRLAYVSAAGAPVLTSIGTRLDVEGAVDLETQIDTLVVPGGDNLVGKPIPDGLVAAARLLHPQVRRTVSICTGAFVLASAGVLSGRRATTHWRHAQVLSRSYPDVAVEPDALFVEDRGVFTSAGVSAGIDLALALVEQDHGAGLARNVARNLVLFMQRPGNQSQFSAPLKMNPVGSRPLREIIDHVSAHPAQDLSVDYMGAMVGLSPRQVSRLFANELGTSPGRFIEQMRLEHAKTFLETGQSVTAAARAAGFGSAESMRRSFVARLQVTPSNYRARFSTTDPRIVSS